MKKIVSIMFVVISTTIGAQPWTSNGVCDLTNNQQWNNGGAKGCACTWYSVSGTDTILNCAYGDCGQSDLLECIYDCNGHNNNPTDMIPRTCDATANPVCWFQGGGSAGELFCSIALPIELSEFWGNSTEDYNELMWTTVTETNNDYFVISHSTDALNFKDLGTMNGVGTSLNETRYRFIHTSPPIGISYYKLKQVDYNGVSEESKIISIRYSIKPTGGLFSDIYPNPTGGQFFFHYSGNDFSTPISIRIVSQQGALISEGSTNKFNSTQAISFEIGDISSGVFLVEISQGDNLEIKKIVKQL